MGSPGERQNLLAAAADFGFRHFDVARSYGDGIAETELGRFLRNRSGEFTIATKFGFAANPLIERFPALQMPVAAVRSVGRKLMEQKRRPFTAAFLRTSIEQSLRALGVDCIDILFLHEPSVDLVPRPDELIAAAEQAKADGKIRFLGVAGEYERATATARVLGPVVEVVQTAESGWHSAGVVPDFTFGTMRTGAQSRLEVPLDRDAAVAGLKAALERRPNGAVVVSSRHVEHLRKLAEIAGGMS
jgi:aryl-alcohol dehydrogenase-like predicted oxidoreductase